MNSVIRERMLKAVPLWLVISLVLIAGISFYLGAPLPASAHVGATITSTCGKAVVDGQVNTSEWSTAATTSFTMVTSASVPLNATLYVMNTRNSLYIGITINDDEFTTAGLYMPQGDAFRIDFDNDHSGTIKVLNDDVLSISAGLPQFIDAFIFIDDMGHASACEDDGIGMVNGQGAATRVNILNHFEVKHPLCSGDSYDFCLSPASILGFRLEYIDSHGNAVPESHFYPGDEDSSVADIVIANCSIGDYSVYLPFIRR